MAPGSWTVDYRPTWHLDDNAREKFSCKALMRIIREINRPWPLISRDTKKPPLIAIWKEQDRQIRKQGGEHATNTAELILAIGQLEEGKVSMTMPGTEGAKKDKNEAEGGENQDGDKNGKGHRNGDADSIREEDEDNDNGAEDDYGEKTDEKEGGKDDGEEAQVASYTASPAPADATTRRQKQRPKRTVDDTTALESDDNRVAATAHEEDASDSNGDVALGEPGEVSINIPTVSLMKKDLQTWGISLKGCRIKADFERRWVPAYQARIGSAAQAGTQTGLRTGADIDKSMKVAKKVPAAMIPSPQKRKHTTLTEDRPSKRQKTCDTGAVAEIEEKDAPTDSAQHDVDIAMGGIDDGSEANPLASSPKDVILKRAIAAASIGPEEEHPKVKQFAPNGSQTHKSSRKLSKEHITTAKLTQAHSAKSKATTSQKEKKTSPEPTRRSGRARKPVMVVDSTPSPEELAFCSGNAKANTLPGNSTLVANDASKAANLDMATQEGSKNRSNASEKIFDKLTPVEAGLVPMPEDDDEYEYIRVGTHVVGDYGLDPVPEFVDVIPMSSLNSFEQRQRRRLQEEAARKKAKEAGVPFEEPKPKVKKWDWREHRRQPGEVRRAPRF